MEESSLPMQPETISFSDFLTALFRALIEERVRPCILRNYEEFPSGSAGGDVDFLIHPSELPDAIRALRSLPGIQFIGFAERQYVAHVFVYGIFRPPCFRALQIDFIWSLGWKGMRYFEFDAETVLKEAIEHRAGVLTFLVPCPAHEAIISLVGGLHASGKLKEKYFPKVHPMFASDRSKVIAALSPESGRKTATQLVDSVIDGDRRRIEDCVNPLHTSMTFRNLLHRPVRTILGVAGYYTRECVVRLSPRSMRTVCILGQDGPSNAAEVEALMPLLTYSAMVVKRCEFGPQLSRDQASLGEETSPGTPIESGNGSLVNMALAAQWLLREWCSRFDKKKGPTLHISNGFRFEMLVDLERHISGIPKWFARLIVKMLPSLDLWILLDRSAIELQSKDQNLPPAEAVRRVKQLRSFVESTGRFIILDASQPAETVREYAYQAIVNMLSERTNKQLKKRFDRP